MFSPGLLWNCWYRKTLYKKRLWLKILPPRHVLNHFSLKLCKSIKRNLQCIVSWNCSFLFPGQFWYSSFKVCPTQIILNVFLCLSLHPVGTRRGDNTILFWGRIILNKNTKGTVEIVPRPPSSFLAVILKGLKHFLSFRWLFEVYSIIIEATQ